MAIRTQDSGAISIIQQHKFMDHFVLVGGNVLSEDAQVCVTIGLFDVAQHLIVGAVLLDDVKDVFDGRSFAERTRDGVAPLSRFRFRIPGFGFIGGES